jgi:methylmalonyl-CoA/ethylmalonyl-CoA epimerase
MMTFDPSRLEGLPHTSAGQMAWVPRDFDRALDFWTTTMGVGPFFLFEKLPFVNVMYRGKPIELEASAAVAYWGNIEVELIVQHSEAPSGYLELPFEERDDRLHHIAIDAADPELLLRQLHAMGGETVMSFDVPGQGRAVYVEMGGGVPQYEVRTLTPQSAIACDYMKAAAASWDRTDPVRALPAHIFD